jgi:hypothetical protein
MLGGTWVKYKKILISFICIIVMFTVGCKKEVSINIKDINLENVIRKIIDKADGEIYKSDVENITVLDAKGKDIKELFGIENLINLKWVNFEENGISNIEPLKELSNLEELCLDNNKIKDIKPLENITSLESLSLSINRIEDISALKNLKNLEKLKLDSNEIMDISPLSGMKNLKYINLSCNKISNVDNLMDLESLSSLYLENNSIISFYELKNVYEKLKKKDFQLESEVENQFMVQSETPNQEASDIQVQIQAEGQTEYIFRFSDSRIITESEINNLNPALLSYARNEIFARHGYVFKIPEFKNYFQSKTWYRPIPSYTGDTEELNSTEAENIKIIQRYEEIYKARSTSSMD